LDTTLGRIPPNNTEAEESVIGAMLLDKEAVNTALEILKAEDFYKEANQEIFRAIISLYNKNEPVDLVTLSEELRKRQTLDSVGGISYLAELSVSVVSAANTKFYCEIVKEKSILRRLIKSSDEIMSLAYQDNKEVNLILEKAEKEIFDITQGVHNKGFYPINDVLLRSFSQIEERAAKKRRIDRTYYRICRY
jgi:primary replicative DNA helicase (EC 3.6.1.-)